jgi:hypothetical protein
MADFSETYQRPAFYILAAIGEGVVVLMLMYYKSIGQGNLFPWWGKIAALILTPLIAYIWASFLED